MKKLTLEQGSAEWLAVRLEKITATDAPAIAGIKGAFNNRQGILREKLGEKKELTDYQKQIFADGHEWEEIVRTQAFDGTAFNFTQAVVVSEANDKFMASLDGIDEENKVILEVKSVTSETKFKEYIDTPPAHYLAQVQWQMMCTGYDTAFLTFVFDGDVSVVTVKRDDKAIAKLVKSAEEFLIELENAKSAGTSLAPVNLPMTPEVDRLIFLKKTQKEMEIQLSMIEEEVKSLSAKLLKDHEARKIENDLITIQEVERKGAVDYARIPELKDVDLEQYRKKPSVSITTKLK